MAVKLVLAYSRMMVTRLSGLVTDFTRCPMPIISWFFFFMSVTKSMGVTPVS